jgi:hypothetical protein
VSGKERCAVKISKLTRYDGRYSDESVGRPLALCENGDYVLYAGVRAREDALLEALNMMLDSAVPHPIEHPTMTKAWNHTREVIRQIEGSR